MKRIFIVLIIVVLVACQPPVTSVSLGPQRRGTPPVAIFESPIEPPVPPRPTLAPPISPIATPTARPTPYLP